jgi:ParB-like chromosome segregation protein Spo0J
MRKKTNADAVRVGFERTAARIAIADIQPLRIVTEAMRRSRKYSQIAASIREIGIVEPPIVARDRDERGNYLLLDGHLRIDILKSFEQIEAVCLISTDDEAFTYNRRVNRIAVIQEHKMILNAIERGVSEERLARALSVNVSEIRRKRQLLKGICSETVELLKDKHVPINTFAELKKLAPMRQIEAAELMVAMNKYTISYAKSIVAATPQSQLVDTRKKKKIKGLTEDQIALMERESANLELDFKVAARSYGADHLDLVLARGYLGKLLGNARIVRYLAQCHPELLTAVQRITAKDAAAIS